jgi:eukaryotic-like serine/threonine-protein kinase
MAGPSTLDRPSGRCLAGRYELREPIGSGGMASVWLAEDARLGRLVAVKLLSEGLAADPAFLARFRREARIAGSLTHPNLVGIYDFDADADPPFLVMEHVPGPDLAERLAAGERVDVERLAADLLAALDFIHRAGVSHRDVKPQNVLIAPDGRALLTDFGIARPQDATSITQTGQMPGTARYMAPELMRGEPATPSSDLYSAGMVLRDCLSTEPQHGPAARLAEQLCDPDPVLRPASAEAALAKLRGTPPRGTLADALADLGPPRELEPPTEPVDAPPTAASDDAVRARATIPGRARLAALGGLVAVALVIAAIASSGGGGPDPALEGLRTSGDASSGGGESPATADGAGDPAQAEETGERGSAQGASGGGEPTAPPDPARGAALNDQGYSLLQAGDPDGAVPILRRAVAAFPEGTDDINYAYALFNLASALRQSGHPAEAIPLLRERLQIPNQTEAVRSELNAALAAVGGSSGEE